MYATASPRRLAPRWVWLCGALAGCGGEDQGATQIPLTVTHRASAAAPFTTDLGYTVQLTRCRVAVRDLVFTTGGAQASTPWWSWLIGQAYAHPGHGGGGEILGELPGRYVVDFTEAGALGEGLFLAGIYDGADFAFDRGAAAPEGPLDEGDPLIEHTLEIAGEACQVDACWAFEATLDQDLGRALTGAPFTLDLTGGARPDVALAFLPVDPFEGDTLLDGVDFAALGAPDDTLTFAPGDDTHTRLIRRTQRHDFYFVYADSE